MDIAETIKGFLMAPVRSFQKARSATAGDSIKYFIILLIINAILTVIVDLVMGSAMLSAIKQAMGQLGMGEIFLAETIGVAIGAIIFVILALILVFVIGGWLHIFVYALGGRKGYLETVKALIFGSTPYMLIGWIPVIGTIIGGIWSLVLSIIGVRELHQVSTGRAFGAVILSAVILLVIIVLIASWFIISLVSVEPLMMT